MHARTVVVLLAVFVSACTHLGPQTVTRDRFDYNKAISDSWKEQTLLNIVKIRYADMPLFVEVASVVSGYTLEQSLNLTGTAIDSPAPDSLTLGAGGKFTDRPTITYSPITGQQFNRSFMTPIPPKAIMFLLQTGWSAELVLPLTVDSINGLRSRVAAGTNQRQGNLGFYQAIKLLGKIQKSGAVSMRIVRKSESDETTVLFFHQDNISPEIRSTLAELDSLLGLQSGSDKVTVTYGLLPETDAEIAMITRSMLQIMISLATQVDVPAEHVSEGRTVGSVPAMFGDDQVTPPVRIHVSGNKPEDAFVSISYKDHWFWIDDRDFRSKRAFAFLMILFSLTETGGKEGLPLITIPAG